MPGCIQQRDTQSLPDNLRLLGEDRNPPLPFQGKGIQKSISVIHPAQLPDPAAGVQQSLRQSRFPCNHMGQQTDADMLLLFPGFLTAHEAASLCNKKLFTVYHTRTHTSRSF